VRRHRPGRIRARKVRAGTARQGSPEGVGPRGQGLGQAAIAPAGTGEEAADLQLWKPCPAGPAAVLRAVLPDSRFWSGPFAVHDELDVPYGTVRLKSGGGGGRPQRVLRFTGRSLGAGKGSSSGGTVVGSAARPAAGPRTTSCCAGLYTADPDAQGNWTFLVDRGPDAVGGRHRWPGWSRHRTSSTPVCSSLGVRYFLRRSEPREVDRKCNTARRTGAFGPLVAEGRTAGCWWGWTCAGDTPGRTGGAGRRCGRGRNKRRHDLNHDVC